MNSNPRVPRKSLQLLHLATRLLGLAGIVAIVVGLVLSFGLDIEWAGAITIIAGVIALAIGIAAEAQSIGKSLLSNRGAVGFNSVLQILLATVLVVGVNYFSFEHWHRRFDCTRERTFTLPSDIAAKLKDLRSDTDIIIYLQHVSFGQRVELRQDEYEQAAEKKIAEKVIDLKEMFEEFSRRFRVHLLDTQKKNYKDREAELKAMFENSAGTSERAKELFDEIKKSPENSIFFYSRASGQLQRLSFNDVYMLDKKASEEANDGRGNLVLNYQGVGPFARKIFNIEEKTPRLTTAIIHPYLGMQNREAAMYTMNGAKKVLDSYSIGGSDLMLRRIEAEGDLTEDPTALTYDESRYEQIEDELNELNESIPEMKKELEENSELLKFWTEKSLAELNKKYIYVYLGDGRQMVILRSEANAVKKSGIPHKFVDVDEDDRRNRTGMHRQNVDVLKHVLESQEEERKNLLREKSGLKAENLAEKRRFSDVEAKMKGVLADVDLLIVPRMTLVNAPRNFRIANRIHKLDPTQLNAIKDYLKQGKPALFLLGPSNEPSEAPGRDNQPDALEAMLTELGFRLPKQTILYNVEAKEFNERKVGITFSRQEVEVPGLLLDDNIVTWSQDRIQEAWKPHPIRTSIRLMSRNIGSKEAQEVRIRHPRPVYYVRTALPAESIGSVLGTMALPGMAAPIQAMTTWTNKLQARPVESAVILVAPRESWNEDNPFIAKNKVPRFTPAKDDDTRKGTTEEPRRGPFPIGVAAEPTIPASWYEKDPKQQKVRVAVIGSGNAFVGQSLAPLKEKMLLDVANWLIGRDDLLARDSETWEYPRLAMQQGSLSYKLWSLGAILGLPLVFFFVGTAVTMVRHMR